MPLTSELSAEIGRRLRKARDDTQAAVDARIRGDSPVIRPGTHAGQPDDLPEAEMIATDEEHFADHETALLHEIDVALGKLESGGYGICAECGREIPEERLLATPTVQLCIECQQLHEREQERRTGRPPTM